jgi:hypothetical protein
MAPTVMAAVEPVLVALGAASDPPCWVAWGDDPASRYMVLAIGVPGLAVVNVRVNVPQEGPRASGKLVRWNRVQTGELSIDVTGGHRLLGFQVEGQILRGVDAEADAVTQFALEVFAAIDGRELPSVAAEAERTRPAKGGRP